MIACSCQVPETAKVLSGMKWNEGKKEIDDEKRNSEPSQFVSYYPKTLFPNARQMLFNVMNNINMHKMCKRKSNAKFLVSVLISLNEASDRQFPEESACKHRAEIADVHSHDS